MKIQLASVGVAGALAGASAQSAQMSLYPGATETTGVSGKLTVAVTDSAASVTGTVDVTYNPAACASSSCGIHVHTGTQCNDAEVGGHFGDFGTDPWATTGYTVANNKAAVNATADVIADSGNDNMINFIGRTIVMHSGVPKKVCGKILPDGLGETVVAADLKVYPNFGLAQAKFSSGTLKLEGSLTELTVTIPDTNEELLEIHHSNSCGSPIGPAHNLTTFNSNTTLSDFIKKASTDISDVTTLGFKLGAECKSMVVAPSSGYVSAWAKGDQVTLQGTLSGVTKGLTLDAGLHGFHVHSGESCDNDGGHLKVGEDDPYAGWKYTSNANGIATANQTTSLDAGVDFASIQGKAVVFHSLDGIKVACGVLSKVTETAEPTSGATTVEPTDGAAASAILSAFAYGPALVAAYYAL